MLRYLHTTVQTFTRGSRSAWYNTGTTRLSHPPTRNKTPAPRLWASPRTFMGYNGRPRIGLVRIRKINSLYHTNINKSINISSVYTVITLECKVALATQTCREKGGTNRMHTHANMRNLPSPEALSPEIEEGAVNQPTNPPPAFPGLA